MGGVDPRTLERWWSEDPTFDALLCTVLISRIVGRLVSSEEAAELSEDDEFGAVVEALVASLDEDWMPISVAEGIADAPDGRPAPPQIAPSRHPHPVRHCPPHQSDRTCVHKRPTGHIADTTSKILSCGLIELTSCLFEVGDDVRANFRRFQPPEPHAVTWNEFPWIGKPSIKGFLVPHNRRFLQRFGIAEIFHRARSATE